MTVEGHEVVSYPIGQTGLDAALAEDFDGCSRICACRAYPGLN